MDFSYSSQIFCSYFGGKLVPMKYATLLTWIGTLVCVLTECLLVTFQINRSEQLASSERMPYVRVGVPVL